MDSLPSEYKDLELSKSEKIIIRSILSQDKYGFLIINANPSMMENDLMHIVITANGILLIKPLDIISQASLFEFVMKAYIDTIHNKSAEFISKKLLNNKNLVGADKRLKVKINTIYLFPNLNRDMVKASVLDSEVKAFIDTNCIFNEDTADIRKDFDSFVNIYLSNTITPVSSELLIIDDSNVNSIMQRLAPEYVTVRISSVSSNTNAQAGVSDDLLVINENDDIVKAYRLDEDQINIINKINKGERLILACAGSGKSVLLISKCFKAATMNPKKKFLITCFNKNLYSLYTWFIDIAGLRANNVQCMTFHKLCKTILNENGYNYIGNDPNKWVSQVSALMSKKDISQKYYGVFIDEVQEFETEWYKICYNLLENKDSNEHIFVICGDKTQKIKSQQKHGKAPWNAGEGYPNYRNKSIHIEKNYRNCIEINDYINRFVVLSKEYLSNINSEESVDPDMFLRGKSVYHGHEVKITSLKRNTTNDEINTIVNAIKYAHTTLNLPYDEIAIIMNLGKYTGIKSGWENYKYCLDYFLKQKLDSLNIPYSIMYNSDDGWAEHYGESGGVKLLKADSVLGLDFRAAIVCGLITLGEYEQSKNVKWENIDDEERERLIKDTQDCIRRLYVACTRAKEYLEIVLPNSKAESVYCDILGRAAKEDS